MRTFRLRLAVLLVLGAGTLAVTSPAQGQKVPRRPRLPAGADTNSAAVYYQYGAQLLQDKPREASEAFYWAHMLSPDWPDPLYARWVALLLNRRYQLAEYLEGDKRTVHSREIVAIDSLYYQALVLNPFIYRRFDQLLFDGYLDDLMSRIHMETGQSIDRRRAQFEIEHDMARKPAERAWMEYARGRFHAAVASYTTALREAKYKAGLLAARARASFLASDYDAALSDMTAALREQRTADEHDLVYFYDSKAVFEHSIAILHELRHEPAAAREAYARALEEDLSYYQAHARLAALALQSGDTATAISEDGLTADLRPAEPTVQTQLGVLLAATGNRTDAVAHFHAAVAADPVFAPPYLELAKTYEALGQADSALVQYGAFLARAARDDGQAAFARARLQALRAAGPPH